MAAEALAEAEGADEREANEERRGWFKPEGFRSGLLDKIFRFIDESPDMRAVEVFFSVDSDGSGELDFYEFEAALEMMKIDLTELQTRSAFTELDEDQSGAIEVEEFMKQMRHEKKWRLRSINKGLQARKEKGIADPKEYLKKVECLDGAERYQAIEAASVSDWERATLRAAWLAGSLEVEDDPERAVWQKEELEAQMAEMKADQEEQEAREAEFLYNKEEQEAIAAEAALKKEEDEAMAAVEEAEREEQEAQWAIADAAREEDEAKEAEAEAEREKQEVR